MHETLELKNFHHIVILAQNSHEAVRAWADVFGFEAPVTAGMEEASANIACFLKSRGIEATAGVSLYRGQPWHADFSQTVFRQEHEFFEINGIGRSEDCFTEFAARRGCGICYMGIVAGNRRDAVLESLTSDDGCGIIVEQKIPLGPFGTVDWTVVETDRLLGTNLCVKQNPGGAHTDHPLLPDFNGLAILVKDIKKTTENWKMIFSDADVQTVNAIVSEDGTRTVCKAAVITGGPFPFYLIDSPKGTLHEYGEKHGCGAYCVSLPDADGHAGKRLDCFGFKPAFGLEFPGRTLTIFETEKLMGANIALC